MSFYLLQFLGGRGEGGGSGRFALGKGERKGDMFRGEKRGEVESTFFMKKGGGRKKRGGGERKGGGGGGRIARLCLMRKGKSRGRGRLLFVICRKRIGSPACLPCFAWLRKEKKKRGSNLCKFE